jgi:hypothetical protein
MVWGGVMSGGGARRVENHGASSNRPQVLRSVALSVPPDQFTRLTARLPSPSITDRSNFSVLWIPQILAA